jgi:tRNA-dependent cyclodipeptide synthase
LSDGDNAVRAFFARGYDDNALFGSKCCLTISVGQDYHEGEKFRATIDLVNSKQFRSCTIIVCDSLQRYSLGLKNSKSPEEYYEHSVKLGDEWIRRNQESLDALEISSEIVRWSHWLEHQEYNFIYNNVCHLYLNNPVFREAVMANGNVFIERCRKKSNINVNEAVAVKYCSDYVKEECAVASLFTLYGCEFNVYPKKLTQAMMVYDRLCLEDRIGWLRVKFKK